MCELIGAEYKNGSSRKCQLQGMGELGFHRFFDFEKISYGKYQIKEIFDEPKPSQDKRKIGNNSIYSTYIELLLMHHLSKRGTSHVETFMRKDLWRMLGMINEKYGKISNDEMKQINPMFTKFEIDNFYLRSNQKLERILSSALNNLRNRFLIEWELLTVIHTEVDGKEKWINANDDAKKEILIAKREILEKFGYETIYQVFSNKRQSEFFNEVNTLLYERHEWDYFFKRYKIIFDAKNIRKAIPSTELKLNRILLNKEIVEYLNNEAQKQYNKSIKKYDDLVDEAETEDELLAALNSFKLPPNYVLAQNLLADELIKIDCEENDDNIALDQSIDLESEYAEIEQFFTLHLLENDNLDINKAKKI